MKKMMFLFFVAGSLVSTSCSKSEVCQCADTYLALMKEVKDANMDQQKMDEIEKKYQPDIVKCEALDKGKSKAELDKMYKEFEACDSYAEMVQLKKEMMKQ